jgi:hypothetical protein
MPQFIDRERDLDDLNKVLIRPGAQFLILYGRRRIGKTTLITHWAMQSGLPWIYWVARRDTAGVLRRELAETLYLHRYPQGSEPPTFDTWRGVFEYAAEVVGNERTILILDEFPYAVEANPALPSALQNAWDHHLKDKNIFLVLAGSHIGVMEDLQRYQAPLFGRFTAQLSVEPLPFSATRAFFPRWPAERRVAAWAILGGVPAYLERFDDRQTIKANVQTHLFDRTGMFRSEPVVLLSDELREPRIYAAILKAIANGNHTIEEIGKATDMDRGNIGGRYLGRLQELHLIERRVPATVPRDQRTTLGRYYLVDNFLRFYFRFIERNLDLLELGLLDELWNLVSEQLAGFIGQYAFEDLCREWVLEQARRGELPFTPQRVGSHWGAQAQVDVVATSWRERAILLGEAKWGHEGIARKVVTELVEKAPFVIPAEGEEQKAWTVHYAFFSRGGFTDAARAEAEKVGATLVDLAALDEGLP